MQNVLDLVISVLPDDKIHKFINVEMVLCLIVVAFLGCMKRNV